MKPYSESLRARMLEKMLAPGARPVTELAEEAGIPPGTLYTWKSRGVEAVEMRKKQERKRRPDDWSIDEKITAVAEASSMSGEDLGVFLRQRGLQEADLKRWRAQIESALKSSGKPARKSQPESKRIRALERELRRKEKALAEAAALLVLKKKAQTIWGDEDDDTGSRSGK